jgi:tryptophan halogenase
MGGALKEPFVSYNDILPNDSAWACQIPYKDKYVELQSFTNCTAIENGWCWNIPLWSRIGTGYNYSSRYVDDDTALEEFKNYLCSDKMLIPRTREEVDTYTFRNLKTRVGTHERTFVKNVVAIGLSAGFIEPLESNGLLSVHEFLFFLIDIMQRGEISQFDRTMYNAQVRDAFDSFAKFVAMHYSMSHRSSTPYWQDTMDRDYPEILGGLVYDPHMQRSNAFQQAGRKFYDVWTNDMDDQNGMIYISVGMNYRQMGGPRISELEYVRGADRVQEVSQAVYEKLQRQYAEWEKVAKEAPHMVDYMQRRFYSE